MINAIIIIIVLGVAGVLFYYKEILPNKRRKEAAINRKLEEERNAKEREQLEHDNEENMKKLNSSETRKMVESSGLAKLLNELGVCKHFTFDKLEQLDEFLDIRFDDVLFYDDRSYDELKQIEEDGMSDECFDFTLFDKFFIFHKNPKCKYSEVDDTEHPLVAYIHEQLETGFDLEAAIELCKVNYCDLKKDIFPLKDFLYCQYKEQKGSLTKYRSNLNKSITEGIYGTATANSMFNSGLDYDYSKVYFYFNKKLVSKRLYTSYNMHNGDNGDIDSLIATFTQANYMAKNSNLNDGSSNNSDYINELKELKKLLDDNIITQDDFDKKKAEILNNK